MGINVQEDSAGSLDPTAIGKLVNDNQIIAALDTIKNYRVHLETQRDHLKEAVVKTKV